MTNSASGVSLTVDYTIADNMAAKLLLSDRHSEYKAGLDDDGFFDDFLSFPERGRADQQSAELQLTGDFGAFDYVAGLYWFHENGKNVQDPTIFLGGPGDFLLKQTVDSEAVYGNVGYHFSDALRVSAGLRYTEDDKHAGTNINSGLIDRERAARLVRGELGPLGELPAERAHERVRHDPERLPVGPVPAASVLPVRLPRLHASRATSSRPNCFVANDNVTALNYEVGLKGQPFDNLQMSIAVFYTDYSDLPYQVSTAIPGAGFDTRNIIVDQTSQGVEWEGIWLRDRLLQHAFDASATSTCDDVDDPQPAPRSRR